MTRLRAGVIDILHGQIQFIPMALRPPAVLRAAIREDPVHGNLVLLKEREDAVM